MKRTLQIGLSLLCAITMSLTMMDSVYSQGVTTSTLTGNVTDNLGEPLTGANVIAIHEPSGTTYGAASDINGNFRIPGMRVGGPYTVRVSFTGFTSAEIRELNLRLGETERQNFVLSETSLELEAITVSARAGSTGQSSGTSTQISAESIANLPSINRGINDFLRVSPQSSAYGSDGITFAGMNNRFNAIYIDGAVNNDVFGLASSGTNGGQTGISPFSLDIIDQLQLVISPYDVTLGGFAGGGINAVTKSGTNTLFASAYRYVQNEGLVGKTNKTAADRIEAERTRVADFVQSSYGLSLGGPIIKNKLFFFANAEIQDDQTPRPFNLAEYTSVAGRASAADLDNLRNHVKSNYGYDPGSFGDTQGALEGTKLFAKLDYNINQNHRLSLRHQYTKAEQYNRFSGNSRTINFDNNGIFFPTKTNSSAVELNSIFGSEYSNKLTLSYVTVRDNRRWLGDPFPYVIINDAAGGQIRMGTEPFSTANQLDQNILAITNNFQLNRGNHTITVGTHNEFYYMYNLFIPQNFGQYTYANLSAFLTDARPSAYVRGYSLVDEITGPGSKAAAEFNAMQLGFYLQDEWNVNSNFVLTYGMRLDIPIITSDPADDGLINSALQTMGQSYDVAKNARGGKAPDGQLMWSPRVGFIYSTSNDLDLVIRGGTGVFTSRIPFVWPGAMFNENGVTRGVVNLSQLPGAAYTGFRADYNNQYKNPNITLPSGDISMFTKDFKYPQVFRGNLATDFVLPFDIRTSIEAIYTKTLNNLYYTQVNSSPAERFRWTGTPDNRPVYANSNIVPQYNAVYLAANTSEGYSYNLSISLAKEFDFGLDVTLAYSYNDSYSLADNTSSQNSSQWRGQVHQFSRNDPAFGRSDFAGGHRVISVLNHRFNWTRDRNNSTLISLFVNAQSGLPYSYVMGGANNVMTERGSTSANRTLAYIPASRNEINLVAVGGLTPDQQWTNLNNYIENSKYLKSRRGDYAEKNGSWAPFTTIFDFSVRQDVGMNIGGQRHRLQLSADIMNIANLLNPEWGVQYFVPGNFNNFELYNFAGYMPDGTTPRFTYTGTKTNEDAFGITSLSSRWRMQFGVRYMFN
jgi:hypothetical protein